MKRTIALVVLAFSTFATAADARPRPLCNRGPTQRQVKSEAAADRFNERSLTAALARAGLTRIALQSVSAGVDEEDPFARRDTEDRAPEPGWIPVPIPRDDRLPSPPSAPLSTLFALDRDGRLVRVRLVPIVKSRQRVAVCCVGGAPGVNPGPRPSTVYYIPPPDKTLAGTVTLQYAARAVDLVGPTCLPRP